MALLSPNVKPSMKNLWITFDPSLVRMKSRVQSCFLTKELMN